MSTEQNIALVRRMFDEMCNGRKLNLASEFYSGNSVYHDPSAPAGPGPEGVKSVIATYQGAFEDAHWNVHELLSADGDRVVARWTGSGTHTSELQGIPPTRKKLTVDGIWLFKLSGGKIVESWNHWDSLGLMQQLGVVPSMEAKK